MNVDQIVDLVRQTLFVALEISMPLLCIAMVVGFAISIFQSVTQINEMTLTFVPKILIFSLTLLILFPWFLKILMKFTHNVLIYQWEKVISVWSYTQ